MTATHLPGDEPFFGEWRAHGSTGQRDRERSRALATALGHDPTAGTDRRAIVVGSKGKGTAVAAMARTLDAAGAVVGTVTSPPFRSNRERLRIGGTSITPPAYAALAAEVAAAVDRLPAPTAGYLSPSGAYLVAGDHALGRTADVIVLEEGLGGRSDEISLFSAELVVVTPVFEEHVGTIGTSVAEIAEDLLAVVDDATRLVVTAPQRPEVEALIRSRADDVGAEVRVVAEARPDLATSLNAISAGVGVAAGTALAARLGLTAPPVTGPLVLPGRDSVHVRHGTTWIVDAPVDPVGVAAARAAAEARLGPPALTLACFPDRKPVEECFAALEGLEVWPVVIADSYLGFRRTPSPRRLDAALLEEAGRADSVLCVGTVSFVAEVLEHLDVDCDRWW